ncbi:MAG: type I-E CRISPR-associated protein Cas5/CasD [Geminicoccaceae bacterium]
MPEFLHFTLAAPMAAMGGLAIGERRYGENRPAKSAVIGILCAALGVRREEEERQLSLDAGLALAILPISSGSLLTDYHTTQVPPARTRKDKGRGWSTRRDQLAESNLNTILSWRDYRQGVAFECLLWSRATQVIPLATLATALARPVFTLYFGRKSCPLGRPPMARLLFADDLPRAFGTEAGTILADTEAETLAGTWRVQRRHVRRDAIHRRHGWMFGQREELVLVPPAESATT